MTISLQNLPADLTDSATGLADRLVRTLAAGNRAKTATAPLVAILTADHAFHEKLAKTFPHFPGARDLFAADDVMRAQSADLNATLQVAYLILAIRAV